MIKNWKIALGFVVFILLVARGGLPAILSVSKIALPVILFYFAVKHITLAIFPDKKEPSKLKQSESDVIKICGKCGKEENSCMKCRMGFKPKS